MRSDVPTETVSDLQPFQASPFKDASYCNLSCCQISKDGQWAWTAKGCSLEVYSLQRVERQSFWCFKTESKDPLIQIGTVTEFTELHSIGSAYPRLLISLEGVNLLCLFDVQSSKVIRALHLPKKVVKVEVVSTEGGACVRTRNLARELRFVFGLVAIAFEDGCVVLVDMCLDEEGFFSSDACPGDICFISLQSRNIAQIREAAILERQHLVFPLNDGDFQNGTFMYLGPERELLTSIHSKSLAVTSLAFIPHLTLLGIGYNFGGFQLWNLHKLLLEYTFPLQEQLNPIISFAFQEPDNDPRNYCYIWVVRGQLNNNQINPEITSEASLFSLGYSKKEWISGFGFLYQGMQNCVHRLDYPLTTKPLQAVDVENGGSRVVAFRCIQQGEALTVSRPEMDELHSEEFNNQDLSLCVMVWEAWVPNKNPAYFLAVFDLNQWYQAQMPSQLRTSKGNHCSYLGIFSLAEVQLKLESSSILDIQISASSLVKYKSNSGSDEMYYPSSLAFKTICMTENGIIKISYLGMQRQVFWEVESLGPSCLLNPTELHNLCVYMGLLPRSSEVSSNVILKRESLLTLALDNNLLNFITCCVWQWASSDIKSGCTLKFLLGWIWKRVTFLKTNSDKICVPLFNCSGLQLDQKSLRVLHSYATQLEHLSSVLKIMHSHTGPISEFGLQELSARQEVSSLLSIYLRIILWLYHCSLLPEHAEGEAYGENEVAFPASLLTGAYNQRRKELKELHPVVGHSDLLLIDGMISQLGDSLSNHWEKSGNVTQKYPPPSLYALLGTYLVKGPSLEDKHCLMLYLLLDMAAFLSDRQCHLEEKLMQFPAAFRINHSRIKLTQGFWMLDHQEFEEAISFLTDPVINCCDIQPWQHTRILKAFLYQGEHQKALRYIHICKPPLHTPEEVKLHLTVLLANKLVTEAFHYQRQCCDERNTEDLLSHFFMGCQQTGNMNALLKLPFSIMEEELLVQFLFSSPEKLSKDLLVMYFLQRSQPLEAARLNDKLKPTIMENDSFKERSAIRKALVAGFLNTLPDTQNKLASEVEAHHLNVASTWRKSSCPAPLSTTIRCNTVHIISQSSRLQELMAMVKETWTTAAIDSPSPIKPKAKDALVWTSESIPFIETPSAKRKPKKRDSEIIYPTPIAKRSFGLLESADSSKIPNKKSRTLDYNPSPRVDFEKGKFARPISADVLSLLQTPPVKRKIPSIKPRVIDEMDSTSTPSSILKVRHPTLRPDSPFNRKLASVAKKLEPKLDMIPQPLMHKMYLDSSTEGEVDKTIRFNIASSSKGSITGSEWSSTPEKEMPLGSFLYRNLGNTSAITLEKSILNWSDKSIGNIEDVSMHNSDQFVDEDSDISINYSIQRRRELNKTNQNVLMVKERPDSSASEILFVANKTLKIAEKSPTIETNLFSSIKKSSLSPPTLSVSVASPRDTLTRQNLSHSQDLMPNLSRENKSPESSHLSEISVKAQIDLSDSDNEYSEAPLSPSQHLYFEASSSNESFESVAKKTSPLRLSNCKVIDNNAHPDEKGDASANCKVESANETLKNSASVCKESSEIMNASENTDKQIVKEFPAPDIYERAFLSHVMKTSSSAKLKLPDEKVSPAILDISSISRRRSPFEKEEEEYKSASFISKSPLSRSPLKSSSPLTFDAKKLETRAATIGDMPRQYEKNSSLESSAVDESNSSSSQLFVSTTFKNEKRQSFNSFIQAEHGTDSSVLDETIYAESDDQQEEEKDENKQINQSLFVNTGVVQTLPGCSKFEYSPNSSVFSKSSQSILELSPSPSVQSEASIFITPEKKVSSKLSPPRAWSSRLRSQSRSESITSVDSGSPISVRSQSIKSSPKEKSVPKTSKNSSSKSSRRTKRLTNSVKELPDFVFSPPIIPEDDDSDRLNDKTPVNTPPALPFVFSPPATRSRVRRKKNEADQSILEMSMTSTGDLGSFSKRAHTRKSKSLAATPPWETFVNVITPGVIQTRHSSVGSLRNRGQSSDNPAQSRKSSLTRHSMQLRTGQTKTRKIVKL